MKTINVEVKTREQLDGLKSAITLEGLSLGPDGSEAFADWCHGFAKFKDPVPKCYVTKGGTMNRLLGLTGTNAYPDDLNIVSFGLDGFEDWQKLVMPRFEIGSRWLDDIVENNLRREKEAA